MGDPPPPPPPPPQGIWAPMPEVLHRIWAQRGQPRPRAKMGIIQGCRVEREARRASRAAQMATKKTRTRRAMVQGGAWGPAQRYFQLWLKGRARKKFWIRAR